MSQWRLGFFASHGGSNMQVIIDACRAAELAATPAVVISNNRQSQALERARSEGIPCFHLSGKTHPDAGDLDQAMLRVLRQHDVRLVILAGYMRKIGPATSGHYAGRTLNIHPALLPRFGGKGMYGTFVHRAVLAAGETHSGATIHLADNEYDHGPIVAQAKVAVADNDTPESLAARVLVQEHKLFVATLQRIVQNEIDLDGLWSGRHRAVSTH